MTSKLTSWYSSDEEEGEIIYFRPAGVAEPEEKKGIEAPPTGLESLGAPLDEEDLESVDPMIESKFEENMGVRLLQLEPEIISQNTDFNSIFENFNDMTKDLLFDYDGIEDDFDGSPAFEIEEQESHATVSGVTYHMKDHDPTMDAIGQASEVATEILRKEHTNAKSLSQSLNLVDQDKKIKNMAQNAYRNVMSFSDDLGKLRTPRNDDAKTIFKYFETISPCERREILLYVSRVPPKKMPIDYYDNYEVSADMMGVDLLYLVAMDTKTQEVYDVGRCGSEVKMNSIRVSTSDDLIKKFCYLYEQGDTPTTGLGFSNALHFLTAVHLVENVGNFTIEENRVDLVCDGVPFEISTRFERDMSPNKVYLDKYSFCHLVLDSRFSTLMAASYASDKGVSDYLSDNRRTNYSGSYPPQHTSLESTIQSLVETHKRLNYKQRLAISEMEYACQLEDIINGKLVEEKFEECKKQCIESIDDCISVNYTKRSHISQWGCSAPFRMLRSGSEKFGLEHTNQDFILQCTILGDCIDPSRKSNYWIEKNELELVMENCCSVSGDTELWGWRDSCSPMIDRVQNVLDSLMCSRVYAASQRLATMALHLHRNTKGGRSFKLILEGSVLMTWTSTHKFIGNQELFTVMLVRKVKDFYKGDIKELERMEGKWKRIMWGGNKYEVSPLFKVGSEEIEDLYSAPRKMAALYAAVLDRKERTRMERLIKMMNLFFVSTVGGTWKTTTIVGKHRYITERIMSGYIDPVLISKDVCSPAKNFKKFADYAYLILLRRCLIEWEHPHTYVATTPLFRFTTDLLGLEMNMHYMMQSSLAAGSRHDETALEKMLVEICDFQERVPLLDIWYQKQKHFMESMEIPMKFQDRLDVYRELRKPEIGTNGKNSLNILMFSACSTVSSKEIKKNQPGNVSGKAVLSTLCTTKAILDMKSYRVGNMIRNFFKKSKSVMVVNKAIESHWCPCLPILLLEMVHSSEDLFYYYFNKGAQKGEREISVMNLFMRYVQVVAEAGMIRLSETMHGDTMYDPKKRDTFYRQTRRKREYKKPATSSEDRSRFGPNQQPDEMAAALAILSRDIGDSTVLNSAMCTKLFSDKIGVLPATVDVHNVQTDSMKPILERVNREIGFHQHDQWLYGKSTCVASTIGVKVSMGQGLLGTSAGVIHNTPLISHRIFMKRAFNVTIEHTVSSDDVSRTCHVPSGMNGIESLGFLKSTFSCYEKMLCATGTMDSSDKRIITENFGEYNNITVMSNPLMNPDASITEQMCVINRLPHMYLLLDIMHARSSAKSVYLNGGSLTQVSVTMRCYNNMLSQKWATTRDYHSLLGSHTGSYVSRLMSEDPGDIVSPLESVIGVKGMTNLYTRRRKMEMKEEDSLDVLLLVGMAGKKRGGEIPSLTSFFDSNEMHSFNRSTKGSYRGLRLETKKQSIFKMKKDKVYRVQESKDSYKELTAFEALEMMMRLPLTNEYLSPAYTSYVEGNSVKFYSSPMTCKPPFRTFTALKTPVPYKELRKVDLVWSDKCSNYSPPNVSKETLRSLRLMKHEEKLKVLEEYERLSSQELIVHHNCGEPKQGFKYSLTSNMGFTPICSFSNTRVESKMTVSPQIWGEVSLECVALDVEFRDTLMAPSVRFTQVNDAGLHVYKSKKSKFESTAGMKFVRISEDCELYRAVDDNGTVIYKLEKPDWTDIDPTTHDEIIPSTMGQAGLSCDTLQLYNYDNYSRCSNRTSLSISKSLGVDIREWTSSGSYLKHKDQRTFRVSKDHFLTHLSPEIKMTGLIDVIRSEDSNKVALCIGPDMIEKDPMKCPRCSKAMKMRERKKGKDPD